MKKKLASICIPSFNGEKFIRQTICAVLRSTYENIEIIICDDNSTDETRKAVGGIHDKRIKLYSDSRHVGVPTNWNRTIEKASGEYVCLLNHDDEISPFWIHYAVSILEKYPQVGWVISAFRIINEQSEVQHVILRFPENRIYFPEESFPIVAKQDGLGPGFVVRKKVLNEIGLYDEATGPAADNEMFMHLAAKHPLFFSITPHTAWRFHPGNLTRRWDREQQTRDGLMILKKVFFQFELPNGLKKCMKPSYRYFFEKTHQVIRKFLDQGNTEMAYKLSQIIDSEKKYLKIRD